MKTNGRATVEDQEDQDDVEAGPEMPPEEEDEQPDDEDGRFFGGGVTKDTAEVLNFIDEREKEATVSIEWITTLAVELLKTHRLQRSLIYLGYGSLP